MTVFYRPSNRSSTPTNQNVTISDEPEPDAPPGGDVILYNDGDVLKAKFSNGSTITVGQG